jgi:hypothetical protein
MTSDRLAWALVTADVASARHEWEDAFRRLGEAQRDPRAADGLRLQLRVVTEELRRRVGSTFTLGELAAEYFRADDWARTAIEEHASVPGWSSSLAVVEGAAFHLYARGATDYEP